MISIVLGLAAALLIALDALRGYRSGRAATALGTYTRQDNASAFWLVIGVKALLSVLLLGMASFLMSQDPS